MLTIKIDTECDGFYLHTNGVPVLCPGGAIYDTGLVGAATNTKADESHLSTLKFKSADWESVCTSGVTNMGTMFQSSERINRDRSGWCVSLFKSDPAAESIPALPSAT